MKKLVSMVVIIVMLVSVFVVGCSSSNNKSAKNTGKKINLTFDNWATGPEADMYKELINEYEKSHPDVKITMQPVPWDNYQDKISTMVAGNSAPDIIYMDGIWLASFAQKNVLYNLNNFAKDKDFNLSDFQKVLRDQASYNGNLYLIPRDLDYVVLFYNKDMFDKANLKYPDETWTWKDLQDAAQKLTIKDANGKITQYGFLSVDDYVSFPFIWQNGGGILSKDGKHGEFNKPETIGAMQFLSDLITKYKVSPDPATIQNEGTSPMFLNKRVAMCTFGRWLVPTLKQKKDIHWGVALLPKGKVNRNSFVDSSGYSIYAGTKHPKEAWDFVKWVSSPAIQEKMASKLGFAVPSRTSVQQKLFANSSDPNDRVFAKQTKYMTPIPDTPDLQHIIDIYNKYFKLMRMGQMTAQDAGKKINDEVNQVLSGK